MCDSIKKIIFYAAKLSEEKKRKSLIYYTKIFENYDSYKGALLIT